MISRLARLLVRAGLAAACTLVVLPAQAQAPWFSGSWPFRHSINIGNPVGTVLTNHQAPVQLTVPFDFNSALADGSDLRVTDSNGVTLIPFWIESWSRTSQSAKVWVRIPSLPVNGTTIYFYYGNSSPPVPVAAPQPPTGPFAKHPIGPLVVSGAPNGNTMLPENAVIDQGRIWLIVADRGVMPWVAALVSSTNGVNWQYEGVMVTPSLPINNLDAPELVRENNTWYIFYSEYPPLCCILPTTASIWVARSITGDIRGPYEVIGTPVLSPSGVDGDWEATRVIEPHLLKRDNGDWVMLYTGDSGNATEQIGMAVSTTGIEGPYVKSPLNPVIPFGPPGSIDAGTIADPWAFKFQDTYYIGYAASPTKARWNTSYVTTKDWITFTKSNQIILDQGPRGTWDDDSAWRGGVMEFNGTYYFPYAGIGQPDSVYRFGLGTQPVVGFPPTVVNNPDAVFNFYDGFDGTSVDWSKWAIVREQAAQGTATVSGGILTLAVPGGDVDWVTLVGPEAFSAGMLLEARARHPDADGSGTTAAQVGFGEIARFNLLRILDYNSPMFLRDTSAAGVTAMGPLPRAIDPANFLVHRVYWNAGDVRYSLDNDPVDIVTTNIPGVELSPWLFAYGAPKPTRLEVDWLRVRRWSGAELSATLDARELPPAWPVAPSALTATAASWSQINLTWTDNAINETGFKIERAPSGGSFAQIATTAANVTAYSDTGRSPSTTYEYRIRATNAAGDSGYSNTASATTPAGTGIMTAPSDLAATAASSSQINLAWTDNTPNETGFKIERAASGGSFAQIAVTGANVTTYSNSGLSASTTYQYRVRATTGAGDSAYSNTASATTLASAPAAPTTLTATPTSSSQINLTWTDNAINETGFKVERKTGAGGTYAQIATAAANATAYADTSVSASTIYFYRVRATNAAGDSGYSNEVTVTTPPSSSLPSPWAQTDIGSTGVAGSASYANGSFTVRGSGADIWGTADAFRYVYQPLTGNGEIIARVASVQNTDAWAKAGVMIRESLASNAEHAMMVVTPANGLAFQRRLTTGGTSTTTAGSAVSAPYWVRLVRIGSVITGYASSNGSSWIQVGSATFVMASTVQIGLAVTAHNNTVLNTSVLDNVSVTTQPAVPASLTAVAASSSQINLSWADVANETGFKIERKTGAGGTYAQIATVGAGVTSYSNTGLAVATTYFYRVRATNTVGDSGYSPEASATTLNAVPAVPTGLTATATSSSQINLVWVDVANETGYKIERKTGAGGTYAQIATVGAGVTAYSNTGLAASTTYFYRVRATNAVGDSAYSTEASATTLGTLPAAPSGLTASPTSSSQINLVWVDNASNETGFKIERKTGAGGTYAQIATVGAGVTSYSNTGLATATTYFYRVRATNTVGDSGYSPEASATTLNAVPAVPTGLTATAASSSQINLVWVDNASNETGFKIERKTGAGGTYAQIATVGAGVIAYSNTGLAASTTYFYRVRATNTVGDSGYSPEASATTLNAVPAVPTGLTATAASSSQINLVWVDNASNETGFKIERKTGAGGTYAQIATVGAGVTAYSNTGLAASTTYFYRVRATNAVGDSAYSTEASATTLGTLPAAPSGLTASPTSSSQINLVWVDNASNETGFKIERKTGAGGTYAQIATVGAGVTSYSNTGLATATTYFYRVRATNTVGDSGYSPEASATTLNAVPAVPTGLTATAASSSQINLVWVDVANETGYKIERKTGAGGTYAQIATVGAGITAYSNTGLAASTTYFYRVRATNAVGDSAYSTEASATTLGTLPAAPSGLTASPTSSSQINLAWVDNASNETGFKIERKTGAGGTYAQIATVGAGVTSYSNTSLAVATTYFYRVRATNAAGDSAYSVEASATTLGPSFRAAASAGSTSGVLLLTIAKPAGTQQGDVMVASIAVRPSTAVITAPGWTLVRRINNANSNANSLAVYTKVAGAAEPGTYAWTFNTSTGAAGGIRSFAGVDTVNPVDVEAGQNTANGLTHTAPSVTTRFSNAMIVTSHAFSSSARFTPPAGMTEAFDVSSDAALGSGGEAIEGNYRLQAAIGASGTSTATASNDADVGNAHTLALRAR